MKVQRCGCGGTLTLKEYSECGRCSSLGPASFRPFTLTGIRLEKDLRALEERHRALAGAVERYLEAPGCNNPSRALAMQKLRWALGESG